MIVAALIGMELFAYLIRFNDNGTVANNLAEGKSPRLNFDNFYNSMITIFIIITGDDWHLITYQYMM